MKKENKKWGRISRKADEVKENRYTDDDNCNKERRQRLGRIKKKRIKKTKINSNEATGEVN